MSEIESIRFIADRFKAIQEVYDTFRKYKEDLLVTFASTHKEVVVHRSEISYLKRDRDDGNDINVVQLAYKFTEQDQSNIIKELINTTLLINFLETILHPGPTIRRHKPIKKLTRVLK